MGLDVVKGNALDVDVLDEAGAASAKALHGITANGEVNLLAARSPPTGSECRSRRRDAATRHKRHARDPRRDRGQAHVSGGQPTPPRGTPTSSGAVWRRSCTPWRRPRRCFPRAGPSNRRRQDSRVLPSLFAPVRASSPSRQERGLSAHDEFVGLGRVERTIAMDHDTIVVAD